MPLYTKHDFRVGPRFIEDIPIGRGEALGAYFTEGLRARALLGGDEELATAMRRGSTSPTYDSVSEPGMMRMVDPGKPIDYSIPVYSAEEATKRGEKLGLTFDEEIPVPAFERLQELKIDEVKRQSIMQRSSVSFPLRFAAGMLGTLIDPVEIGLNFVPVPGLNSLTRKIGSTVLRRGVRGAVEGFVGSAILEPIVYTRMTQEQADYTMRDSLMNLAMGTVAGSALHTTLGGIGDLYTRRAARTKAMRAAGDDLARIELAEASAKQDFTLGQRLEAASPETRLDAIRGTIGQKIDGRINDVSEVLEADPGYKNPDHSPAEIQAARNENVNINQQVEDINARNTGTENLALANPEGSRQADVDNKSNVDISKPDEMDARLTDDEAVLLKELEALDIPDEVRSAMGLEGSARIEGDVAIETRVPKAIADATEAVAVSRKFADAIRFIGDCLSG